MKLLFIFLVCSLIQTQAAVYSQQTKVSVELKNVSLERVFLELEQQTDCSFLYNHQVVASKGKVSVQMVDKELSVVLDELLPKLGLGFIFDDNLVIIKERPQTWKKDSVRKSLRIVGKVLDEKKQPMPGVTVKLEKTSVGTATNSKGVFSLLLPIQKGVLEFSFIGFKSQKISFSEVIRDTLHITMEEDVQALDETVVVAYGTTNKREMTGAVSVVKADEIKGIPTPSIANLLQGRVAGMDVINMSGAPGGAGTAVTIRGYNSLDVEQGRRFSDPLWVVDGVPMNSFVSPVTGTNMLADLNPDMIESVQVLKDASSAAIYGSRAANGVIIVTTKKGKRNQDATFSVNASRTWGYLPRLPTVSTGRAERNLRLLESRRKFSAYLDSKTNTWRYPTSMEDSYGKYASFDGNFIWEPNDQNNGSMYQDSLNAFYNHSTNFFPIYYETGTVTNANMQTYGGTDRMTYGIGLGYYDEVGIFKGTGYSRVDVNATMNVIPVSRVNVDLRLNASLANRKRATKDNYIGLSAAPSIEVVPGEPYGLSSLLPGDGTVVWDQILEAYKDTKEKNRSVRLRTNFKIGADIVEGLNISASLAADYAINRRNYFQPSTLSESGYSKSIGETGVALMVLNEDLITYEKSFRDVHHISLVAGFSYQYDQSEYNGGSAEKSPSDKIEYAPNTMPDLGYSSRGYPEAYQGYQSDMQEKVLASYFFRMEYNYLKKYLLSVSFRRDGSSTFGANNRWGSFPSIAAGWNFTEESFMQSTSSWLNFGKIRASWGRSGMHFDQNYLALGSLYVGGSYLGMSRLLPHTEDGLYNDKLSWEETDQYDFGLDVDMLNYRLGVTLDYYYRYSDKMLCLVEIPGTYNGYSKQWRNAAAISNEGIELMVKYELFRQENLYWKVSINAARNWNRFEKSYDGWDLDGKIIGKPLNGIYAWKTDGYVDTMDDVPSFYSTTGQKRYLSMWGLNTDFYIPGDYKYVDITGDGEIGTEDQLYQGSALPLVSGGIVSEIRWKNFDMNFLFSYQLGRHMVNMAPIQSLGHTPGNEAVTLDLRKTTFWEKSGDISDFPMFQYNSRYTFTAVDRSVEKVNWLKLKTLVLGYSLPSALLKKVGMKQVRLFVSGENLFTWDNYSGLDPETVNITTGIDETTPYPLARRFTVGLTLKF